MVRWLDVPDPRRSVLDDAVTRARAARIELNEIARGLAVANCSDRIDAVHSVLPLSRWEQTSDFITEGEA